MIFLLTRLEACFVELGFEDVYKKGSVILNVYGTGIASISLHWCDKRFLLALKLSFDDAMID